MVTRRARLPGPVSSYYANRAADSLNAGYRSNRQNLAPLQSKGTRLFGQPDFTTNADGCSPTQFSGLHGVSIYNGVMFLSDSLNHRILVWNSIPKISQTPPDFVLGQITFTATTSGTSASKLNSPFASVATDGQRLVVSDTFNNRVLVWNQIPSTNGAAADVVLGQSDFTQTAANRGGSVSANTFNNPCGALILNSKLYVADSLNNRILVWNSLAFTNGQSADVVLGQSLFTTSTAAQGSSGLSEAVSISTDGTGLAVADRANNRVLIWNAIPTVNGTIANVVVGQADFTGNSTGSSSSNLNFPQDVGYYLGRFFISDRRNNRILIYNSVPSTNGATADAVLGQANFTANSVNSGNMNPIEFGFDEPTALCLGPHGLFVCERWNHRMQGYLQIP